MSPAIAIITYKNRYKDLLGSLDVISDKYDVYVCLQDNDDNIQSYDVYKEKYINDKHIKFVTLNDAGTIATKRQKALDYIYAQGHRYLIEVDDDLKPYASKITEESKRSTSNSYSKIRITIEELFDKMVSTMTQHDAAFVSPKFPFSIGFSKPGVLLVNKSLNYGQCVCLDMQKIKENNISYTTSNDIHEDVDLVFQLLQHGLTCITLGDYAFIVKENSKTNSVIGCTNHYNLRYIHLYLKYKDGISLFVGKHGEIRSIIRLSKYFNTFELPVKNDAYHQKLYMLCQEAIKDENKINDIIEHIKNKKTHGK